MEDFPRPCAYCAEGKHDQCDNTTCGCLVEHHADDQLMRNLKAIKRTLHPERESWTKGGW